MTDFLKGLAALMKEHEIEFRTINGICLESRTEEIYLTECEMDHSTVSGYITEDSND